MQVCLEDRRVERWEAYQREFGSDMSTVQTRLKTHGGTSSSNLRAIRTRIATCVILTEPRALIFVAG